MTVSFTEVLPQMSIELTHAGGTLVLWSRAQSTMNNTGRMPTPITISWHVTTKCYLDQI